jgi:hypothetical protein
MELNDYPHFDFAEDGRLCSMGQHCSGFPRVLYDTVVHLGYDGDAAVYHCRLSMAHGMDQCEVSMTIPFDPMEPWSGFIIGEAARTASPLLQHCLLSFSRSGIRRTPYGSSVLRPCPTSRALTSMPR